MTTLREAAQQALEALNSFVEISDFTPAVAVHAISTLQNALMSGTDGAEQSRGGATLAEQSVEHGEPVAWMSEHRFDELRKGFTVMTTLTKQRAFEDDVALYTAPQPSKPAKQRHISYVCPQCHWTLQEQEPLTDEEIEQAYRELWRNTPGDVFYTAQNWIEQGIKYAERAHGIGETK